MIKRNALVTGHALAALSFVFMTAFVYCGLALQPAMAQLEEIVVTARKREEALVDIPFAVSAFSEEELNTSNMKNFVDMSLFTPGLTYQQATANRADRGVPNIVIRGLNINAFSSSSVAALFFIDGAPVFGGEVGSFVDVIRVEVLRGPQSAYFGRNTFSGAVNLVTKDPGEEFGGSVGLDTDQFGTADLQLSVEGPIIADRLSFRLSGRSNKKGGHYKNNRTGAREIGDEETRSLVATFLARPTDALRFKLRLEDIEINDGPQPSFRFPGSFANCDSDGNGTVTYLCGLPPDVSVAESMVGHNDAFAPGYLSSGNYVRDVLEAYSLYSDSSSRQIDDEGVFIEGMGLAKRISGATFSAAAELPGGMSLDWISGFNETKSMIVSDENTLPRKPFSPIADTFLVERWSKNSSHEARLSSSGEGRFRWTAGANYVESEDVASCVAGWFFAPRGFTCRPILDSSTVGAFGGVYYDFTEKLTVSAEARSQNDEVNVESGGLTAEFEDIGGRVTIQYRTDNDLMLFANYARGFRPGTFNSIIVTLSAAEAASLEANSGAQLDVAPETLDQFEVGVKGTLLEGRMQGSLVGYWGEIKDQQVQQIGEFVDDDTGLLSPVGILTNVGLLDMSGIELEARFQLTEQWLLTGAFARNYTEYVEGTCNLCVSNGATATNRDHLGNQTFQTPEFTGSATATYTRPLFGGGMEGFVRGEFQYESTKYATEANIFETGSRNLVNLRLGVEAERYRVEGYVTNLFDDDTYIYVAINSDLDTFGRAFVSSLPYKRAFGVRGTFRF